MSKLMHIEGPCERYFDAKSGTWLVRMAKKPKKIPKPYEGHFRKKARRWLNPDGARFGPLAVPRVSLYYGDLVRQGDVRELTGDELKKAERAATARAKKAAAEAAAAKKKAEAEAEAARLKAEAEAKVAADRAAAEADADDEPTDTTESTKAEGKG